VEEGLRGTVVVSRRPNQTDKPRTALKEEKKERKVKKKKNVSVNSCYEFVLPVNTITRTQGMPKLRVSKALQSSKT